MQPSCCLFPRFPLPRRSWKVPWRRSIRAKKQILLQTDKGQETVEFSAATKGADKVKAGDKVKVNYTEKAGKIVADTIDASKSSAAPSAGDRPMAPGGMKDAPPSGVR